MVVSILTCALFGAAALSVVVILMGGTLLQALIVYFFFSCLIVLGLAALRVGRPRARRKRTIHDLGFHDNQAKQFERRQIK